ncbi:MAG: MarR family transcriptional regulator [Ruaniaceae bacterium]|nr:MarR family transcriptional regulator [Ruaniaceae bacterium]
MNTRDTDLADARELARMIVTVAEQARASFGAAVAPFGIPVHLARTLLVLGDPQPMRHIASELACDPSHVTGIADQLEERGLASRTQGSDRRVKMLKLTNEGQKLRTQIANAIDEEAKFASHLDAAQKDALRGLLGLLLDPPHKATHTSKDKTT